MLKFEDPPDTIFTKLLADAIHFGIHEALDESLGPIDKWRYVQEMPRFSQYFDEQDAKRTLERLAICNKDSERLWHLNDFHYCLLYDVLESYLCFQLGPTELEMLWDYPLVEVSGAKIFYAHFQDITELFFDLDFFLFEEVLKKDNDPKLLELKVCEKGDFSPKPPDPAIYKKGSQEYPVSYDSHEDRLIVLVEGPSDETIIREVCKKLGFGYEYNLRFIYLGGDSMDQFDLSAFEDLIPDRIIALIDTDHKSFRRRNAFKKKCKEMGIFCQQLQRYSIENYLSIKAIKQIFPNKVDLISISELEPKKKVESQLGFDVKKNGPKIVRLMSLEDLSDTDLLFFCKEIQKRLKILRPFSYPET